MSKPNGKNVPAITEAAHRAATTWAAVEGAAKRIHDEVKDRRASANSAVIRLSGGRVQGVIRADNMVIEIDS